MIKLILFSFILLTIEFGAANYYSNPYNTFNSLYRYFPTSFKNRYPFRPTTTPAPKQLVDDECNLTAFPPDPSSQCCGVDINSSNRIVGGEPTGLFQYPWMALIEYTLKDPLYTATSCAGSLISGRYVLTAGHCVAGEILENKRPTSVILGAYDRTKTGKSCVKLYGLTQCAPPPVKIRIEKTIAHEKYNDVSLANDIALIRLRTMAPFTDTIRPICLPSQDFTLQRQKYIWLYVSGWGAMTQTKIRKDKFKNEVSPVKRHVKVPFVPLKTCKAILPYVTPMQVCAGGEEGKDSCAGDSGGPLMYERDGMFEEVGIVSFGKGNQCGVAGLPAVYTNVYKYLPWIQKNIVK